MHHAGGRNTHTAVTLHRGERLEEVGLPGQDASTPKDLQVLQVLELLARGVPENLAAFLKLIH